MADSILDPKPSHVVNFSLKLKHQIWLQFIAPGIITSILYIVTIATDIIVGIALLLQRQMIAGAVTLTIVYAPAVVCFLLQLTLRQPWTFKSFMIWFLKGFLHFIIFPLRTLQSLGELMFCLVEAAHSKNDVQVSLQSRQSALPQCVHVYLFLQPFLQCAPQAILQLHLLYLQLSTNIFTERAQILCILCSVTTVALSFAFYHCYESKCVATQSSTLQKHSYEEMTKAENEVPFIVRKQCIDIQDEKPAGTMVTYLGFVPACLHFIFSLLIHYYLYIFLRAQFSISIQTI